MVARLEAEKKKMQTELSCKQNQVAAVPQTDAREEFELPGGKKKY